MEIKRVDPYLLRWSADGVVALATESAGVQFLFIESDELLAARLRWRRLPSSLPAGRIVDMQWSRTLMASDGGCLLACVFDSGSVAIVDVADETTTLVHEFLGQYSAACWIGDVLVLGDAHGVLRGYRNYTQVWESQAPVRSRIIALAGRKGRIGTVTLDQQCWLIEDGRWASIVGPGKTHVDTIAFSEKEFVVLQHGTLILSDGTRPSQTLSMDSLRPGQILAHAAGISVIHNNGHISGSHESGAPRIQGDVVGACMHPTLPMAVIAVNGTALEDWKYPILSWESVNLAVFPLSGDSPVPRRVDAAAPASWLVSLMKDLPAGNSPPPPPLTVQDSLPLGDLQVALEAVFCSELFDYERLQWYKKESERSRIEENMRKSIALVLQKVRPETIMDKLVVSLYLGQRHDEFSVLGDSISDVFEAGSLQQPPSTATSKSGRPWRQCSMTLLPLLTLDTRVSAEGLFVSYKKLPAIDETAGSNLAAGTNPVAEALLNAAKFCIFTGSNWKTSA